MKELKLSGCLTHSENSFHCFEHIRCHARIQELHGKEFEENRWAIELEQAQLNDNQCSITYDRSYASNSVSNEGDQVSLEEPSSEVVIHMKRKTKHHSKNY